MNDQDLRSNRTSTVSLEEKRVRVRFNPSGISTSAPLQTTVADIAIGKNLPIRLDCGEKGVCGKCRVIVNPAANVTQAMPAEFVHLTEDQVEAGYRLACQTRITGPCIVTIPESMADTREVYGRKSIRGVHAVEPMTERLFLSKRRLPEPLDGFAGSLADWIGERLKVESGELTSAALPITKDALWQLSFPQVADGEMTLVRHYERGITAVIPGHRKQRFGIAFDIGTTTVAAYLCDPESGEILTSAASVNPQRRYGEDVISRIACVNADPANLDLLKRLIAETINELIARCLEAVDGCTDEIDEVSVVGNTTMSQLLCGFHPHALGATPFLPLARLFPAMSAADLGLHLNPGTHVHIFPVISGFVGGDTLGAVLADGTHHREETTLLIDIGTNGELVIGNRDRLWATSCATGPALEGAQISRGMRAVSGAVHKVELSADGRIIPHVIGEPGTPPLGICGSGIIDAIAAMRRAGVIKSSGNLDPEKPGVIADEKGVGREFVLAETDGARISVTLKDVRQIQLAKSALGVGIRMLMHRAGVERIDRTVLTGAFGAHFNWRNAAAIGMVPKEALSGEVLTQENLAGVGAVMALLNRSRREEARRLNRRIRFIELATNPDFAMEFTRSTAFPELDE